MSRLQSKESGSLKAIRRISQVKSAMKKLQQVKGKVLSILLVLMLVSTSATAETYYFHNDHLGTPQVLTDSTQQVVWKGEYDPFGKVTETVSTVEQNLRFPGQYYDSETGLHYNYFRTYDPSTGRYVESDPIGLDDGPSLYSYAGQNPSNLIDEDGKAKKKKRRHKSPRTICIWCGATHGGLRGPYCPECYDKSLDPDGQIPPLIIDPKTGKLSWNQRQEQADDMACSI